MGLRSSILLGRMIVTSPAVYSRDRLNSQLPNKSMKLSVIVVIHFALRLRYSICFFRYSFNAKASIPIINLIWGPRVTFRLTLSLAAIFFEKLYRALHQYSLSR
jgi:hypothetical protein